MSADGGVSSCAGRGVPWRSPPPSAGLASRPVPLGSAPARAGPWLGGPEDARVASGAGGRPWASGKSSAGRARPGSPSSAAGAAGAPAPGLCGRRRALVSCRPRPGWLARCLPPQRSGPREASGPLGRAVTETVWKIGHRFPRAPTPDSGGRHRPPPRAREGRPGSQLLLAAAGRSGRGLGPRPAAAPGPGPWSRAAPASLVPSEDVVARGLCP